MKTLQLSIIVIVCITLGIISTLQFSYSQTQPSLEEQLEQARQNIQPAKIVVDSNSPPLKQFKSGIAVEDIKCKEGLQLVIKARDGSPACVKPESISKLVDRGWAVSAPQKFEPPDTNSELGTSPLQIKVVGENQVRRGTTHSIEIQVVRGNIPIEGARVFIDIEDYGEDIIKEFDGYTNSEGYFVFSWEIPQSFDDVETLLAFIDVTDGISSKTELFKFQVYCLPGEKNCKVEGN